MNYDLNKKLTSHEIYDAFSQSGYHTLFIIVEDSKPWDKVMWDKVMFMFNKTLYKN